MFETIKELYESCKYLLPCKHCDKFDKTCSQYKVEPVSNQIDHEHRWVCVGATSTNLHYECTICGKSKYQDI